MSKLYQSKKTGLNVVNGTVKEVASDGLSLTVGVRQWNFNEQKENNIEVKILSPVPVPYKEGDTIVASGYLHGKDTIMADSIGKGGTYFETPDLAVVHGKITGAKYWSEEGKLKKDGVTPKSPHYDISVRVIEKDQDGNNVFKTHVIQTYNNKFEPDAIEKMQKKFDKFTELNDNGYPVMKKEILATVVTRPGNSGPFKTFSDRNGVEQRSVTVYHMGKLSMDIEFINSKEKTKEAPQNETAREEAPKTEDIEKAGSNELTEENFEDLEDVAFI